MFKITFVCIYLKAGTISDQTASTSVFDSTSFKGNPAEEDIIPIENQGRITSGAFFQNICFL